MKEYRDYYFKKAKKDNYPARSVYKLKDMDRRFKLFTPGQKIIDLGAAPGSWTMYAAERVGKKGRVLALDLNPLQVAVPGNVIFFQEDIFSEDPEFLHRAKELAPFDVFLSDMAPQTTGIKFTDQARSHRLAESAFELSLNWLRPGGHLVVKIFQGPDSQELARLMKLEFKRVKQFKPKSSRAESKEMFFLAMELKPRE
ncbi:MAG: RlmE family RNA methyltransferase [Desulfonatronovibrionaceae bacterium]